MGVGHGHGHGPQDGGQLTGHAGARYRWRLAVSFGLIATFFVWLTSSRSLMATTLCSIG